MQKQHENLGERSSQSRYLGTKKSQARQFLDVAGVMIVAIDRCERVSLANQRACAILGYPENEVIGLNWFNHFLPDRTRENTRATYGKLMNGELDTAGRFENSVLTRDGRERLIAWQNTVLRDEQGNIVGTLSSGEDVTERRLSERALQFLTGDAAKLSGDAFFETVVRFLVGFLKIDMAIVGSLADESGEVMTTVASFHKDRKMEQLECHLEGTPYKQTLDNVSQCYPKNVCSFFPESQLLRQMDAESYAGVRLANVAGESLGILYAIGSRPIDEPDFVLSILATFAIRVSAELERLRDQRALTKSEQMYRSLVESVPSVIWSTDEKGRTCFVSSNIERICGFTPDEVCVQSSRILFDRIHLEDQEAVRQAFADLINNRTRFDVEYRQQCKDDSWIWVRNQADRVICENGLRVAYGVFSNITARKQAELKLMEAHEEIKRLNERIAAENTYLKKEIKHSRLHPGIVAQSQAMKLVLAQAEQVAATDSTVVITGETGTGKEIIAQAIHNMSKRKGKTLYALNCAAMPNTLVESELFGREKGAYTGALTRQKGRFELADGSTIFLDEIAELSLEIQAKLLRVLQEGKFERLGSAVSTSVDVRIIAATNRNLEREVEEGRFRSDLFYRLNVFPIAIPPLRERRDDIPKLVWTFVTELSERMGKRIETIPKSTMSRLLEHLWPGNVRELRNTIERGMILTKGTHLQVELPSAKDVGAASLFLMDVDREHITSVLKTTGWKVRGANGAAVLLGLKPTTLESKMKKLGIVKKK